MDASAWLTTTAELQRRYGYDPIRLLDEEERRRYVAANLAAAMVELGEVGQEVDFRPWKDKVVDVDRVIEEVVDVMHHLANILYAHCVDDYDFWTAYSQKVEKNRRRTDHHVVERPAS